MSLDELESDGQTAEILLCFYETYEPVFCTDEKVERIMRSFRKKAEKSGEHWRTMMYAEFKKAKGIHPRTFYEQQAEKDGRLPEWMDLEVSESLEAKARIEARRAQQEHDDNLEALERHRVQLEIEGRKEFYEAQKRTTSATMELEPVIEMSRATAGASSSAHARRPPTGADRIEHAARAKMQRLNQSAASAECRRRHLSDEGNLADLRDRLVRHEIGTKLGASEYARKPAAQLEESAERLSKPRVRPAKPEPPARSASRPRARTPSRLATNETWSDEQHRKALEKMRARQNSSPEAFQHSLRGGTSMRALSSPPRTGPHDGWRVTGKPAPPLGSEPPASRRQRPKTPRRSADELYKTLGDTSTQRTRRRRQSQGSIGSFPQEEPPRVKRNSSYYDKRIQRSRSAPRPRRSAANTGETDMGPVTPLGMAEPISKLIVHTAWWVASHGQKFEALIASKNAGNANWTFLTHPETKEAVFYRERLNYERALGHKQESIADSESQGSRHDAVVDRLLSPTRSRAAHNSRMGPGRAGAGWEYSLRGHSEARARTPSSRGSRTPRRDRGSSGPRQRSRTPGSSRSSSSERRTRYPQSPGRERGRTPGGQSRPVERLELDTSGRSTGRGWQSPGRQRSATGSNNRRQRASSVGRNTRSPGRSRDGAYSEWRCEWCGESAPKRYNGPQGPASLCRTCATSFQASWQKAKNLNQKRAKTPRKPRGADEDSIGTVNASYSQSREEASQGSELAKLRNESLPARNPKEAHEKEPKHPPLTMAVQQPQLSMPDKKARKELFDRIDVNGNGGLSLAEIDKAVVEGLLGSVLGCPNFNHKPALIRAYKAADKSGDGFIERSEFTKLLHFIVYFNNCWHMFEEIDSDHDRRLSKMEFVAGCATMGLNLSAAEATAEFAACDTDGGGMILFGEFCAWCAEQDYRREHREGKSQLQPEPESQPVSSVVRNLCTRQDLNYPTVDEVMHALNKAEDNVRNAVELLRREGRDRAARVALDMSLPQAEIVRTAATKRYQQQPDSQRTQQPTPSNQAPILAPAAAGGPVKAANADRRRRAPPETGLFKTWDKKAAEFEQLAAQTEGIVHGQQNHSTKYTISTSAGGAGTVMVKSIDRSNPDLLTVTCPAGFAGGRSQVLFVRTPAGEELEIPVPEGIESDDDFDVDMGDVVDEDSPKRSSRQKHYSVSTSSGGPATVQVKASGGPNPDAITVTCPAGFQAGHVLYVTTPDGEELEIPIPDGVETDDEFDVDMGDVSDDDDEDE